MSAGKSLSPLSKPLWSTVGTQQPADALPKSPVSAANSQAPLLHVASAHSSTPLTAPAQSAAVLQQVVSWPQVLFWQTSMVQALPSSQSRTPAQHPAAELGL
jgi:hypothetical protein